MDGKTIPEADRTDRTLYTLGDLECEAMPDHMDARLKRLRFRAHHMGTNENDLLFGGFADQNLTTLTAEQLDRFEALIEEGDPDLFLWITEAKPVPERYDHDIMRMLRSFTLAATRQ